MQRSLLCLEDRSDFFPRLMRSFLLPGKRPDFIAGFFAGKHRHGARELSVERAGTPHNRSNDTPQDTDIQRLFDAFEKKTLLSLDKKTHARGGERA
jgi:hypothetical protein